MSLALDVQINVVLEDIVWTTSTASINFGKPAILIMTAGAYACLLHDSLDGQLANVDTTVTTDSIDLEEDRVLLRLHTGRPLVAIKDVSQESGSMMDTKPRQ